VDLRFTFLAAKASTIELPFNFPGFSMPQPIENVENDAAGESLRSVMFARLFAKKVKNVKYRQYNICLYFAELQF